TAVLTYIFFFQAEDGIRDFHVTGVQTCALPILFGMISGSAVSNIASVGVFTIPTMKRTGYSARDAGAIEAVGSTGGQLMPPVMEIGRASCREREWVLGAGVWGAKDEETHRG